MKAVLINARWWLIGNAVLITVYLWLASRFWHQIDDVDTAFTRGFIYVPLFAVAIVLNLAWLGVSLMAALTQHGELKRMLLLALVSAVWFASCLLDRSQWGLPQ